MANYNKVILVGNLTRDPQLTYLPSQMAVVDFGLAINRTWMGQNNQKKEEVCFIDCKAFGKQAETINQYMKKGRQILVEGHLRFEQWQAQDGSKRSKHTVTVDSFQFLGPGPGAEGGAPGTRPPMRAPQGQMPPADEGPAPDVGPSDGAPEPGSGDDIPF